MTAPHDQRIIEHAAARFERSCATLDDVTREALRSRRRAVLASTAPPAVAWRRFIPAGAMATMMAIAGAVWLAPPATPVQPAASNVSVRSALATANETAGALDDDPDFYLWLASTPVADTGTNATTQSDDEERTL